MPNDRDEESGRFRKQYPEEAFMNAVNKLDMATTSKVAEDVGCSYDLAYRRLHSLAEKEELTKTDVGGSFIWSQR